MKLIRFEVKKTGSGIFIGRYQKSITKETRELVNKLAELHESPELDSKISTPWHRVTKTREYRWEYVKFGFTLKAFRKNHLTSTILMELMKRPDVKMRVIYGKVVIWKSASGIQAAFVDE